MDGGRGGFILGLKKPEPELGHLLSSSAAVPNLFTPRKSLKLARLRWGLSATLCSENISRITCTCTQRKCGRIYVGLCLWDSKRGAHAHSYLFTPPKYPTRFLVASLKTCLTCIQTCLVHISTYVTVMLTYSWFSSVSRHMPEFTSRSATTSSLPILYISLSTYHSTSWFFVMPN